MQLQLEFINQVRRDLNRDGLLFNDMCHKIFDYLIDTYTTPEELIVVMADSEALEDALNGSRLEPVMSGATPLQWAYIASVFKEIARKSSERSTRSDKHVLGSKKTASHMKQLGY